MYPNNLRKNGFDFGISSAASCLLNVGKVGSCKRAANMPYAMVCAYTSAKLFGVIS